jgi:ComF family protein
MKLRKSLESFLHILMPRVCCGCDRALHIHEELLCLDCLFHLPITDFHLDKNNESARQLWGKLDFEYTFSMLYLSKSSCVEKLLHRLKFKGFSEIGEYFGEKYAISLLDIHSKQPFDFIIPIPIHPSKLRIRGYNQAECFAKGLAKGLNVPLLNDVLFKTKLSASQTTKSRTERYENVEHVFGIKEDISLLENKHVLLVDDVLTTGATLCAAGNMLKDRGALVSIATLARA